MTDLIPTVVLSYPCCKPKGLHAGGSASVRNAPDNKYCENQHCFVKKKKKGCAPRVTSIFHFTEVIVNGFTSPSAPLLWTLFMGFTSLPITRCTDFFTHISKRCLWLELVRTVLLQRQSQTYCCGYPCRRISRD